MIQKVFKHLERLQAHIEQLPLEQKAILSSNLNYLSSALQELAIEFQPLWNPQAAQASGDRISSFFYPKIAKQAATIRQLERELEQSQSQYKKVTQALTQGEARLQTILRNSSDLITIIETDGRIRDQSPLALDRILGYKPEQRIGKFQSDLLHPDDFSTWQAYFAKLLKHPGIAPPIEYRKRHISGDWIYLEVIANNLLHDSSINGIIINSRDITQRKLSESELEKSQKQIVNILENVTDGFYALNRQWQFTYVNPKAEECLHRKRQELLGNNIWEQFPDTAKTIFFDEFHKAVSRNVTVKFEAYYEQLNIWFEVEAYPSEEGLSVFFQNITDRKNAENALRASESRYRILSQITSDFAYSFKVLPDNTWVCEWMTEAFTKITGYTPKEIATSGGLQFDCIHPDDVEMLLEQMQLRSSSRKEVSEYRIVTKTEEIRWLWDCRQVVWDEVKGCAVRIYGACQDITEHKLVEAKLCETNLVLQELIKALPIAVVGIDANALVTVWNPASERIFGWKQSEVLGELLPIVPSDENVDFYAMFQSELAGEAQVAKQCRRRRKDGSLIDVCISTAPMRDANGLITGSMRIVSEISAAKGSQEENDSPQPFWARYVCLPNIIMKK